MKLLSEADDRRQEDHRQYQFVVMAIWLMIAMFANVEYVTVTAIGGCVLGWCVCAIAGLANYCRSNRRRS